MEIDGVANSRTTDMYSFGVVAWEVLSGKRPSDQYARMAALTRPRRPLLLEPRCCRPPEGLLHL